MATMLFGACAAYLAWDLYNTRSARPREIDRQFSRADMAALTAKMARDAQITVTLAAACFPEKRPGEPQPPWLAFPDMGVTHIGWRMGAGESYIHSVFWPFWRHLDQAAREDYFRRYDLGADWPERDAWYYGWVDVEDADTE
jgi:hypothetical protein